MFAEINLNAQDDQGLDLYLVCTGFSALSDENESDIIIDTQYCLCTKGTTGKYKKVSGTMVSQTSKNNIMPVLDAQGNQVYETVLDEQGNSVQVPKMTNRIAYWKATLGDNYIIPSLQIKLQSIVDNGEFTLS